MVGLLMAIADAAFPEGGVVWNALHTEAETLVYFCEPAEIGALFRQKIDTYSNLAFLFYGLLMLGYSRLDRGQREGGFAVLHPQWSRWFGLAMVATFLGSTFFHASLTRSGEAVDLAGTYATALLPGFFNLHRLVSFFKRRWLPVWPFALAWGLVWLVASLLIFRLSSRIVVPGGLLLVGLSGFVMWLRVHPRSGWWWAAGSLLLSVVAAACFVMDIQKVGCEPGSWMQAHGFWHIFSGSAAASYYAFMRRIR